MDIQGTGERTAREPGDGDHREPADERQQGDHSVDSRQQAAAESDASAGTGVLATAADTADRVAEDGRQLSQRLRTMDAQRRDGWSWERIVNSDARPTLPTLVARTVRHVGELLRHVQRSIAHGLSSEGASHGQIAEYFEVSRQRISKLMSKSAPNG